MLNLAPHIEYADDRLTGLISRDVAADLAGQLKVLPALVHASDARLIATGRNRSVCVELDVRGERTQVLVKCFGRQSPRNDWRDSIRGSKAERSFRAAHHLRQHDVGTPEPLAYVERWHGRRLEESYYVSAFLGNATGFGDQLLRLYHQVRECEDFVESLRIVAEGTRRMHDSGFVHNDLGNQNILIEGSGGAAQFSTIDLNRGRIISDPGLRERARDLSRLSIPSGMIDLFLAMYWNDEVPKPLVKWLGWYRGLFDLHAASRKWRHPIREARIAREQADEPADSRYPDPRDVWIWDSRTVQAFGAMNRKERLASYPRSRYLPMIRETFGSGPGVYREFRRVSANAFESGITMGDRLGLSIEPHPDTFERKLELISTLPSIPMLVRLYHHESPAELAWRKRAVTELMDRGHAVAVALVQDRDAVRAPDAWARFASAALDGLNDRLDFVEVAHAINRVKWGIWDFDELEALYRPIVDLARRHPALRFTGPAGIDFEYPFILAALKRWPAGVPLHALSHHLYVDRRGAPENPQNAFSAIEKFALARAIATNCGKTDRMMVTGVNWPLAGAGPWSPIAPPHVGVTDDVGGVDETTYAAYMLRYLVLASASGLVDRVYWWQLVSRGFGLIDDANPAEWRERPAWHALQHFHDVMSDARLATAERPEAAGNIGRFCLTFDRDSGERFAMTWSHGTDAPLPAVDCERVSDMTGKPIDRPHRVDGSPIFLRHIRAIIASATLVLADVDAYVVALALV